MAEGATTLTALSSRIFEFKGKYMPRYRRWRSRMVMLLLLGGVALVMMIVLWILRAAPAGGIRPACPARRAAVQAGHGVHAGTLRTGAADEGLTSSRRPTSRRAGTSHRTRAVNPWARAVGHADRGRLT